MAVTPSEALVERLCGKAFLSLWGLPNPVASQGKELCDFLVVCGSEVVIFSVKEVTLGEGEPEELDYTKWHRWHRRAVEESAEQIYGAERRLSRMPRVSAPNGSASASPHK
jgi:hypothetical protein